MTAVKRVFTHSAIRSAIRKPFIANDDGYREYLKRSVFEFNGTQWGESSKLLVLNSSFEIEVTVSGIPEGTSSVAKVMFSILQANSSGKNIHIGRRNGDILTFAFYSSDINVDLAGLIDWNKVNTFNCKYDHSTGEKVVFLNGSEVAREVQPKLNIDWNLPTSTYFMQRLGGNNGITPGILFSTKVWTNGDSNTGDLILNVPFNEQDTDYQRDLTSTITDINDPNWRGVILQNALPEDWMQIEKKRWWDYWLGVNLYTQEAWESPFFLGGQWTYDESDNTWLMTGDGGLSPLQVISQELQPVSALLKYEIKRISGVGTAALTSAKVSGLYTLGEEEFDNNGVAKGAITFNANDFNQSFKRRSGVLTMRVSKPELYKYFEYAEGAS